MDLSTVGGWLACRGAGQYSTRYGKIEDMVLGLEVVLADGRIVRTEGTGPAPPPGPNLTQLFVGSEGTLGVITEARLRIHPLPPAQERRAFGFATFAAGLEACRRILRRGATPAVLRLYDQTESARNFEQPDTNVLIVLDEADPALLAAHDGRGRRGVRRPAPVRTPLDVALVERWLGHRNDVSALAPLWRAGIVVDTAEMSGRGPRSPASSTRWSRALQAIEGTLAASAHQSHAYTDGACLYFTFAGRGPEGDADWRERYYRQAWDTVTDATLAHGAAISHHHGIGLNRSRFLPRRPRLGLRRAARPEGDASTPPASSTRASSACRPPSGPRPGHERHGRQRPRRRRRDLGRARRHRAPRRHRRARAPRRRSCPTRRRPGLVEFDAAAHGRRRARGGHRRARRRAGRSRRWASPTSGPRASCGSGPPGSRSLRASGGRTCAPSAPA